MIHRWKYVCINLLFVLSISAAEAQLPTSLFFQHLTTKDGLSSNLTTSIAEDRQGFLWIGTKNGLNRYDKYRMKQYFHDDNDSTSLIHNTIDGLHCDKKGRLWIITPQGISCFLPDRNRFVNYSSESAAPRKLKNNSHLYLFEDKDGTIWLANQREYLFKVKDDLTLEALPLKTTFQPEQPEFRGYLGMLTDKKERIWAFCGSRIYLVDTATKQPAHTFDCGSQLKNDFIVQLKEDWAGNFWVTGWNGGIWRFDPDKGTLSPVLNTINNTFTDLTNWRLQGRNFFLALGNYSGLYVSEDDGREFKKFSSNYNDPLSIRGRIFFSLFTDSHNNLFICTDNGINYTQSSWTAFDIFPITEPGATNYQPEKSEIVFSFFEDTMGTWLSKRYKSTLLYGDSMQVKRYYTSLYPLSTSDYRWSMHAYSYFRRGKELFISTDSGLVAYTPARSQLYVPYSIQKYPDLRTILPLDSQTLLIRSFSRGLFVFNTVSRQFTGRVEYKDFDRQLALNCLFRTSKGHILAGSEKGNSLLEFFPGTRQLTPIVPSNEEQFHLLSRFVLAIAEATDGRLWLATDNGLFVYDPTANRVEKHFTVDGKMGETYRVCFDRHGNVWANGESGIWCYETAKDKWINFNGEDGLPGNSFEGVMTQKANGDIVAGLEGAIAVFHPDRLTVAARENHAVITEMSIDNALVPFSLAKDSTKKTIKLSSGQNSFSVDFSVLDYHGKGATRYFYKISPSMTEFRENNDGHINFNGLMPGHYILLVRGGDKAGNIFSRQDQLEITIEPAWYQTAWFKGLVFLVLVTITVFFVKRKIRRVRNDWQLKQKVIETEMQALRAQMAPHFIFNSLNSIENFIMKNEKRLASDYLNKFATLMRTILESSRNELTLVPKDLEALQLYVDLELICCNHRFTYTAHLAPELDYEDYHVPSLLILPYLENAINHGLTPSKKEFLHLMVTVSLSPAGDQIKYTIEDNGIGRVKAAQYKSRNKPNHKSVGLAITAERIHLFNRGYAIGQHVVITDLYDEAQQPCGTRVEITIKAI